MQTQLYPNSTAAKSGLELFSGLIVMLALACLPMRAWAEDKKGGNMEGTWVCESAAVNGVALPEATVKLLRLNLTKDRYQTTKGTQVLFESSYRVDPTRQPAEINIVGTEGELTGKEAQGIYSLAGDTLKICYTMPGKPRPKTFESAAGSDAYYMVWKRQSP